VNPTTNPTTTGARPRVWLVAGTAGAAEPADHPRVRDDLMRVWVSGVDGCYHTADGRHHACWTELHARYDLVEVA
jgi:hypothetical protein